MTRLSPVEQNITQKQLVPTTKDWVNPELPKTQVMLFIIVPKFTIHGMLFSADNLSL